MAEFEVRAPEATPRRAESAKDVHFKLTLARQVKQLVARFMSKLKASWAELVRMRVFPGTLADLGNLPVEALILLKEDLLVQQLVVDVLIKTASTSGAGTSDATQKVMAILQDPDADLLAMIQAGEVSFAGASPLVRLYGLPSFAFMFSTAASKFFVSEPSKAGTALKDYVERQLTFKTSGGTLRLHPGYLRLKHLLTKAYAAKAEIPVKDVYMAISEKLELCDGLSVVLDEVIHKMYITRQPYRQGAVPGIEVLKDLVARVGVLADAEAVRSGLKTVGLSDPAPRRTYGVTRSPEEDGECPELVDSDDEGDRRVQATARARAAPEPPVCPVCFAPGISGCYWVKCHRQFAKPSTVCDKCGTSTLTVQYNESGCRARAALPMCGADDPATGVVIGPSHTVLT